MTQGSMASGCEFAPRLCPLLPPQSLPLPKTHPLYSLLFILLSPFSFNSLLPWQLLQSTSAQMQWHQTSICFDSHSGIQKEHGGVDSHCSITSRQGWLTAASKGHLLPWHTPLPHDGIGELDFLHGPQGQAFQLRQETHCLRSNEALLQPCTDYSGSQIHPIQGEVNWTPPRDGGVAKF